MPAWVPIVAALVVIVVVVWPRRGLWGRWREACRLAERARQEDALKHILKCEANGEVATLLSVAGALGVGDSAGATVLRDLEAKRLITFEGGRLALLPAGRELGLHVVRAHRLWESYLAEETGVEEARWHHLAERKEHLLSPGQTEALAARLGHPLHDPHGDVIPERGARLAAEAGRSLNTIEVDRPFTIAHIEDEPEAAYAQLLRLGLHPGMRAYVLDRTSAGLRIWTEGRTIGLAPSLAQHLSVVPLAGTTSGQLRQERFLHELEPGERGRVLGLAAGCRGAERRRLLDLGFVPGSIVEANLASPAGDPTAYLVRGTLIALRREQARLIRVEPAGREAA